MPHRFGYPKNGLFCLLLGCFCLSSVGELSAQQAGAFELLDGDRVVFVGNTFVEREIKYGHIEAALTMQWPQRNFTFRNLGWSGDDARGRARRFFGEIEDGFNHLKTHVFGLQPSVIFVAYGAMESFAGREGLPDFINNMDRLLDDLVETGAHIVVVSPTPHENLGPPLPDPIANNQNLKLYTETLRSIASLRRHRFIDLYQHLDAEMRRSKIPLTDNGIHLNDTGYRIAARGILLGLGLIPVERAVLASARGQFLQVSGVSPHQIQSHGNGVNISLMDTGSNSEDLLKITIRDLFSGTYLLRLNGRNLGSYHAYEWASGIDLPWTPAIDQYEELLRSIKKKNEFFFHQWRPQNETYLRGFRSYEQGQNASELEEFDPYIAQEEKKIVGLKQPRFYTLQLFREPERRR